MTEEKETESPPDEWEKGRRYKIMEKMQRKGRVYMCRTPHISVKWKHDKRKWIDLVQQQRIVTIIEGAEDVVEAPDQLGDRAEVTDENA